MRADEIFDLNNVLLHADLGARLDNDARRDEERLQHLALFVLEGHLREEEEEERG